MNIGDFDFYHEFFKKESGLFLTPEQSSLLDARLTPVFKAWKYSSLEAMTMALRAMPEPQMVRDVLEAMVDSETSFFRHPEQFTALAHQVLPPLLAARKKKQKLRIWSAGTSHGQEAYSIAMTLKDEAAAMAGRSIAFLATDISIPALEQAASGSYSRLEIQRGLPSRQMIACFEPLRDRWQISEELQRMVTFKYFNLVLDMAPLGIFDVIFCRNVLASFDPAMQKRTLKALSSQLAPDGFLFLGEGESPAGLEEFFAARKLCPGLFSPR